MNWTLTDDRPIWLQLSEQLTLRVAAGVYPRGSRMPAVRELAAEAGVNPNTMQRALSQLEADGLVVTNRTAGRTVTEDDGVLGSICLRLANAKMKEYLGSMEALGFTRRQAIDLLEKQEESTDGE
jgi:GntR family transcriptional regulator